MSELYKHGFILHADTNLKVRLIMVVLKNGPEEILITNLSYTKDFPKAYSRHFTSNVRGAETNYDTVKNKVQLEAFSGHKVNNIMQDFYASFFMANLQEILSKQAKARILEKTKHLKHGYQVNKNVTIGLFKNRVVGLFLSDSPEKILNKLE